MRKKIVLGKHGSLDGDSIGEIMDEFSKYPRDAQIHYNYNYDGDSSFQVIQYREPTVEEIEKERQSEINSTIAHYKIIKEKLSKFGVEIPE